MFRLVPYTSNSMVVGMKDIKLLLQHYARRGPREHYSAVSARNLVESLEHREGGRGKEGLMDAVFRMVVVLFQALFFSDFAFLLLSIPRQPPLAPLCCYLHFSIKSPNVCCYPHDRPSSPLLPMR